MLTIKIDFSLVYILRMLPHIWKTLVNSAGQSFQTSTIGNEQASFVVSLLQLQLHRHIHYMNYQRRLTSSFLSVKLLTVFYPSLSELDRL